MPGRRPSTPSGHMTQRRIDLIAKRQVDLDNGHPDYHVYAGKQLVGRIYKTNLTGAGDQWVWGVDALRSTYRSAP